MQTIITALLVAAVCLSTGITAVAARSQDGVPNDGSSWSLARNSQAMANAISENKSTAPRQPPQSGSSNALGSLSHQLSRSGGVIHPPPSGDRSIVQPPKQGTSSTPVIPPPGTPGGNPLVQPK